jgi:Ca2+-binding EF-hand superfamily protein
MATYEELAKQSGFSDEEVSRIVSAFRKFDKDASGGIDERELSNGIDRIHNLI